jgi:hypothetical protein
VAALEREVVRLRGQLEALRSELGVVLEDEQAPA